MADVVIGAKLQLDANDGVKSMQAFKKEIKEAQGALLAMTDKFGATSKEAQEAAKRVAALKDKLGDAKSLVDAFNPDQKFRALSQSLGGVLGGFSALTGAMGLLGVESDQVQKQLLKVQSAMALSQGLNQVGDAVQSFKNLAAIIQTSTIYQKAANVVTVIATAVQRAFGVAVVQTSVGFNLLKVAIASTGIGLLVVGLGVLISKISEWVGSTDDAADAQGRLKRSIDSVNDSLDKNLQKIDYDTRKKILLAKIAGKTENELLDITIKGIDKEIIELRVASDKKAAIFNKELAAKKLDNAELQKLRDDAVKAEDEVQKKSQQRILTGLEFDAQQAANRRAAPRGKPVEKPVEKLKRDDTATDPAVLAEVGKAELILGTRQKLNESLISSEATRRGIEKANSENAIRDAEAEAAAKLAIAESVGNALNVLSDLVGRQTAAGKVLGISSALINTYVGVTKALSAAPPPLNFIQAATVLAAGLLAVKNIVKVQVPGQGSVSAPSVSTSISAPLQPRPQVTNTRLDAGQLNQIGNAANPVRAFVVEHDITTNQERIRRLNRAARI